jgi:hypothetical protein
MTLKQSRNFVIVSSVGWIILVTLVGALVHTNQELYLGPILVAKPGNLALQFGIVALSIIIVLQAAIWVFFKFLLWLNLRPLRSELRDLEKAVHQLKEEKWAK